MSVGCLTLRPEHLNLVGWNRETPETPEMWGRSLVTSYPIWIRCHEVTHLTSPGLEGGDCDMVKLYKIVDLYSHVVHHFSFKFQCRLDMWYMWIVLFYLFLESLLVYSFMTQKPKKMSLLVGFLEGHLRVTSWHVCCFALPGTWRAHKAPCMLWAQCIEPRGIKGHVSRKMIRSFYQLIPESIW